MEREDKGYSRNSGVPTILNVIGRDGMDGMTPKICCEGKVFSFEVCGVRIPGVSTAD